MWSLSLHVRNLVSTVQARLQLIRHIGWEADLWFQRGGWHETADFWRCRMWWAQLVILGKAQASTLLRSLYFTTLLFTAAAYLHPGTVDAEWNEGPCAECSNLARSGFAKQTPGRAPWPDAPDTTTRSSIKASSLSRAALSLPWMSAGTDGAACAVNSFPLQEVSLRCGGGATLCSRQKDGVGPTSWRQGGRKH